MALIDLVVGQEKPDNVYDEVYAMEQVPSSHGDDIYYLLVHGKVRWGEDREHPMDAFFIAMQYSKSVGKRVSISQPAHIVDKDMSRVMAALAKFVADNEKRLNHGKT